MGIHPDANDYLMSFMPALFTILTGPDGLSGMCFYMKIQMRRLSAI